MKEKGRRNVNGKKKKEKRMENGLPHLVLNVDFEDDNDMEGVASTYSMERLTELERVTAELIEADCHVVVMDGEVLFNTYRPMGYRDRISEFVIREQLIQDTHRHLFVPLLRQNRDFEIEIFMFQVNSWKIVIRYNHETMMFTLFKYQ